MKRSVIVFIFCSLVFLISCSTVNTTNVHTHEWKTEITEEEHIFTCECGWTYITPHIADGDNCYICGEKIKHSKGCERHNFNIEYIYPTSCKEFGYTLMTCEMCGHRETVIWDKSNPNNLNHSYEVIEETYSSHCEEAGCILMKCKVCGEIKKEHNYHIIEKKERTCYSPGYIKKECSECGRIAIERIPAGHTFIWEETSFIDYYREYCTSCHKYSGRVKDHGKIYNF